MCGIVAQYGPGDADELLPMLDRLVHRGPDDAGTVEVGGHWLGHRRLSIVDVDGGHQPLRLPDDSALLVGNGEIYNHATLRRVLADRELLTRSDNEVALHLIDRDGPDALVLTNGMFALVFAGADGRFVAARDPVGIKPLYWARRGGDDPLRLGDCTPTTRPGRRAPSRSRPGVTGRPETGLRRFAESVPPHRAARCRATRCAVLATWSSTPSSGR